MNTLIISAVIGGIPIFLFLLWSKQPETARDSSATPEGDAPIGRLSKVWRLSRVALVTIAAVAALAVVALVSGSFISPELALRQTVFGALFGVVFAYWLHLVLFAQASAEENDKGALVRFGVIWFVMLALLLFGLVDERTVLKLARLGANVKLPGGAELAIGKGDARSTDTSLAVIVPPTQGTSNAAAPDASSGLELFTGLPDAIRRDALYYALIKGLFATAPPIDVQTRANLDAMQTAIVQTDIYAGKMGKCLQTFVKENEDDFLAGGLLEMLGETLRDLATSSSDKQNRVDRLPSHLSAFVNTFADTLDPPIVDVCAQWVSIMKNPEQQKKLLKYFRQDVVSRRPYVWSAAASIFAYQHRYAPSIALLHKWIDRSKAREDGVGRELSKIYALRARSLVAAYMEEWINYRPLAKTPKILAYHQNNLEESIKSLDDILKQRSSMGVEEKTARLTSFVADDPCDKFAASRDWSVDVKKLILSTEASSGSRANDGSRDYLSPARIEMALFLTLVSLKRTWIDAVLAQRAMNGDIDGDNATAMLQRVAEELRDFDTRCFRLVRQTAESNGARYADLVKAQNLEAFARAYRAVAHGMTNESKRERLLEEALKAAEQGMKLVAPQAEDDAEQSKTLSTTESRFSDFIAGTEALQTSQHLHLVAAQINAELGR